MNITIKKKFTLLISVLGISLTIFSVYTTSLFLGNKDVIESIRNELTPQMLTAHESKGLFQTYIKDSEVALSIGEQQIIDGNHTLIEKLEQNNQLLGLAQGSFTNLHELNLAFFKSVMDSGPTNSETLKLAERLKTAKNFLASKIQTANQIASANYNQKINTFNKEIQFSVRFIPILLAILTLFLTVGTLLVLNSVFRRIRLFSDYFAATDINKLEEFKHKEIKDEFASLVKSSNAMIASIRKSREQLVEKEFVDSVFETMNDMLFIVDTNGFVVKYNLSAENNLQFSFADLESKSLQDMFFDEEAPVPLIIDRISKGERLHFDCQMITNIEDTSLYVSVSASGLFQDREFAAGVISIRDITKYHNAQLENAQIQAQLQQSSKLAALGTLGAGVAHELNNPLSGVRGFADMIPYKLDDPEKIKDCVAKIVKATERMQKIINQLRVFARNTTDDEWTAVSINEAVNDSLMLLQRNFEISGVEVELQLQEPILAIKGDCSQLQSVIQNLLGNSRDAFAELTDQRTKKITIKTKSSIENVSLTYQDNAGGIPKKIIDNVFDPFFTTKKVGKGTGIGLSISHSIIKDHNGDIQVHSTAGEGTTFELRFPALEFYFDQINEDNGVDDILDGITSDVSRNSPSGQALTALVIDDEKLVTEIISNYLEDDFNTKVYHSPKKAIEYARQNKIDIIITDMKMPDMSGLDVIDAIRAFDQYTPIIVCTGHANTDFDIKEIKARGAFEVIEKPLPPRVKFVKTLLDTVAAHQNRKSA